MVSNRFRRLSHRLFGDRGELPEQSNLGGLVRGAAGRMLEEIFELGPTLAAAEDQLQPLEGLLAGRIHGEDAAEIRHRPVGVAELLVVKGSGTLAEGQLRALGKTGPGQELGDEMDTVRLGQIGRASGACTQVLGPIPEFKIVGELVQGAEDGGEGSAGSSELLVFDVCQLAVQLSAAARGLLRLHQYGEHLGLTSRITDLVVLGLEHLGRARPHRLTPRPLRLYRGIDQAREDRDCIGIVRLQLQGTDARFEGLERLVQTGNIELCQLDLALSPAFAGGDVSVTGNHFGRAAEVFAGKEQARERTECVAAPRLELGRLPIEDDGVLQVSKYVLLEGRPLFVDLRRGSPARRWPRASRRASAGPLGARRRGGAHRRSGSSPCPSDLG